MNIAHLRITRRNQFLTKKEFFDRLTQNISKKSEIFCRPDLFRAHKKKMKKAIDQKVNKECALCPYKLYN